MKIRGWAVPDLPNVKLAWPEPPVATGGDAAATLIVNVADAAGPSALVAV